MVVWLKLCVGYALSFIHIFLYAIRSCVIIISFNLCTFLYLFVNMFRVILCVSEGEGFGTQGMASECHHWTVNTSLRFSLVTPAHLQHWILSKHMENQVLRLVWTYQIRGIYQNYLTAISIIGSSASQWVFDFSYITIKVTKIFGKYIFISYNIRNM